MRLGNCQLAKQTSKQNKSEEIRDSSHLPKEQRTKKYHNPKHICIRQMCTWFHERNTIRSKTTDQLQQSDSG